MILTIAGRELRSLFVSPLAWVVLAVVQVIIAFLFLAQIDDFLALQSRLVGVPGAPGITQIVVAPVFAVAGFVMMLVVPLLSMRTISEERQTGTLTLLLSSPVSLTQIVLGKFAGIGAFLMIMLCMIAVMPLSLLAGSPLDLGQLGAGVLGLGLLLLSFGAIGLFLSSLTAEPVVAAVSTFGTLLFLWIIDWAGKSGADGSTGVAGYLSILRHYESLLMGRFESQDVIYYLLIISVFLVLTVWRLDMDRAN